MKQQQKSLSTLTVFFVFFCSTSFKSVISSSSFFSSSPHSQVHKTPGRRPVSEDAIFNPSSTSTPIIGFRPISLSIFDPKNNNSFQSEDFDKITVGKELGLAPRKRKPENQNYSGIENINRFCGFDQGVTELMRSTEGPSVSTEVYNDAHQLGTYFLGISPERISNHRIPEPNSAEKESRSNSESNSSNHSRFLMTTATTKAFSSIPSKISSGTGLSLTDGQRKGYWDRTILEDYDELSLHSSSDEIKSINESDILPLVARNEAEFLASISEEKEDLLPIFARGDEDFGASLDFILENLEECMFKSPAIANEITKKFASDSLEDEDEEDFPSISNFSGSPKAQIYSFDQAFNPLGYMRTSSTPSPSFNGQPLKRMDSSAPHLFSSELSESEVFEMEYKPWKPIGASHWLREENFDAIRKNFDLFPLRCGTETIENPETEEGRNFFPPVFKPFQYYGELQENAPKMAEAVKTTQGLSAIVSDKVTEIRNEKLKVKDRDSSISRHEVALKYAETVSSVGLPEGDWIHLFLAGGIVDFAAIPFDDQIGAPEDDEWTLIRCRRFICAIIPSIQFSPHFEEVLTDFMNDFFLPRVVKKSSEWAVTEIDRIRLSRELTQIARKMIKELICPSIFDSFLISVHPILSESDCEYLYAVLVETMDKFTVPDPLTVVHRSEPRKPSHKDEKYKSIHGGKAAKTLVYNEDMAAYELALKAYQIELKRDERKARYQEEVIRYKNIQKSRSFEFLKNLINYIPGPVMKPDSIWINRKYFNMKKREKEATREITQSSTSVSQKKSSRLSQSDRLIMGLDSHENQDFFDALFFSRILRASLISENMVDFLSIHIQPFLRFHRIEINDSPQGFRYLKSVNKFMKITRFNLVANVHPQIINQRRYLVAYLIRDGANWMGILPSKVQSRCITLEFISLFESLHLFQVLGPQSSMEFRADRLKTLISTKEISFQIPIIFFAYNPVEYQVILKIIESVLRENPEISISKLNAYYEIFAMAKNIELLSIYERKVLKFKVPRAMKTSTDGPPVSILQNINKNMPYRPSLPDFYEALYDWNMTRRLKNISSIGSHLDYPYGTFASRILLARRFGVSFDSSHFIPQLGENFTWLECIEFANFVLEREAQNLINRAAHHLLDSDLYQVYRVIDSQEHLHRNRQLPMDEPTHHINLLIEAGLNSLTKEQADIILTQYPKLILFDLYSKGMLTVDPRDVLNLTGEKAVRILKYFCNPHNVPEAFDLRLFL